MDSNVKISVGRLPIELQERIWREVYSEVIATISREKPRVSWAKNKSRRLKELLKNEIGAYQCGYADFDIEINPFYCMLCAHVNFPCRNCGLYIFNRLLEPEIFHYEFEPFYENDNWEDPYNNEYIWDIEPYPFPSAINDA